MTLPAVRPFAVVTGASSGIGYELAQCCAEHGFDLLVVADGPRSAMMRGEADVVTGWKNKVESAVANVTPAGMLAEEHRKKAEPGSARS